jgi:PAS domain S-box-containing protein
VTKLTFAQLVDIAQIRKLIEAHCQITGIGAAILDTDENILVAVGCQDICSCFHRTHPIAKLHCRESDAYIKAHLPDCSCGYLDYRCKNGLVDVAVPIIIGGEHLATFFTGQFCYDDDKPDVEYFRTQAEEFGFDEAEYLEALGRVPIFTRAHVRNIVDYYRNLVEIITGMGLKNLQLSQEVAERKKSEQRFALMNFALDHVHEAAYLVDEHARFLYVNEESCRALGYSHDDLLSMNVSDIAPDDQMDGWPDHWYDIKTNGPLTFETRHETREGRIFPVEITASIFEYEGRDHCLALVRDITERKRVEEALRRERALVRCIIDSASDLIFIKDCDSVYLGCNKASEKFIGLSESEQIGKTDFDFFDREKAEIIRQNDLQVIKGGKTFRAEEWVVFPDGSRILMDTQKVPIYGPDGEIKGLVGICRDITERKQMEEELRLAHNELEKRVAERTEQLGKTAEALRKSEERYALAVKGSNDGIWDLDLATGEAYHSSRWKSILGYEDNEITGNFKEWESRLHPDDYQRVMEAGKACEEGRIPAFEVEYRLRHKDGSYHWVLSRGACLRDSQGRAYRMAGSLSDITEHKKLEQQLLQAQKMESIGMLAGGVAHEFNNLLTAISGYGQILQESIAADDELSRESIANVIKAAERAAELTRGLLAFSRKQVINTKPVRIDTLISNTGKIIQRVIGEDIEFNIGFSGENLLVKADPGQIEQVLMNMVTNARDAMPHGGRLSVTTRQVVVKEGSEMQYDLPDPGKYALISVTDSGTGIDKKSLESIFEPFYTTKEVGKGTGLGLSIVHGIIKQHNGSILVSSEPGKGTTFNIYLPLVEGHAVKEESKTSALPLNGVETLLVAEDEEIVRMFLKRILERAGYKVIVADDGEEAVARFREHGDISLVLSDVVMPGKNGREVLTEVRKMKPGIKVVFISGYAADMISRKGMIEEGTEFITKPFRKNDLLQKIREVLDRD